MNQTRRPHRKSEDQEDDQTVHRRRKKLVLDDRPSALSDMRHGDVPAFNFSLE